MTSNFDNQKQRTDASAIAEASLRVADILPAWAGAYGGRNVAEEPDITGPSDAALPDALMKAVENGDIDAMLTGFNLLWHSGRRIKALAWLAYVNELPERNVKCLWNEAMLLFFGNEIAGSPVKKDRFRAMALLEYIVEHYYDFTRDDGPAVVQKAYIFILKHNVHECGALPLCSYELWKATRRDNSAAYSATGVQWCEALDRCRALPDGKGAGRIVFNCLDELYMDDMWLLEHGVDSADGFFVRKGDKYRDLKDAVRASRGCMGAWQAYLFFSSLRIKNAECRPVFEEERLPVVIPETGMRAGFAVECTWWCARKGMYREKATIKFDGRTQAPLLQVLSQEQI